MNGQLVCLFALWVAFSAAELIVTTKNGKIRGTTLKTGNEPPVEAFLGIPYAVPPLGDLRFQETHPTEDWEGILDATKEGKFCIANDFLDNADAQSEDCLFLNVFSPNTSGNYAVMVFIHGGRYVSGSIQLAMYNPSSLVAEGVVVATLQYRLGPYGLLSTEDLVVPGNAGMKDQVLALQWIKDNIGSFGGDPEKITIFGESAGGSACGLQVLSPKSAGLFRAAICQSGSGLTPFSVNRHPRRYAYQLAALLDSSVSESTHDSAQLLEFLKLQTPDAIINASLVLATVLEKEDGQPSPSIEVDHEGAFLIENPYETMQKGTFNTVPMILGLVSEESLLFMNSLEIIKAEAERLDSEDGYIYPYDFEPKNPSDGKEIQQYIRNIYLVPNGTFSDNLYAVVKYRSDDMFNRGVIKHAEMQSQYADVYFYQFSYKGSLNLPHEDLQGSEGMCGHADDLFYLFDTEMAAQMQQSDSDRLTLKRMVRLWTNFAKYLNPTPTPDALLGNVIWSKLEKENFRVFNINRTLEVVDNPKEETYAKWSEAYYKWNKTPFITF